MSTSKKLTAKQQHALTLLEHGPMSSSDLYAQISPGGQSRAGITRTLRGLSSLGLICETRPAAGNHYVDRTWELTQHVISRLSAAEQQLLLDVHTQQQTTPGPCTITDADTGTAQQLAAYGLTGTRTDHETGQQLMWLKSAGEHAAEQVIRRR